jgi:hypothetical protein
MSFLPDTRTRTSPSGHKFSKRTTQNNILDSSSCFLPFILYSSSLSPAFIFNSSSSHPALFAFHPPLLFPLFFIHPPLLLPLFSIHPPIFRPLPLFSLFFSIHPPSSSLYSPSVHPHSHMMIIWRSSRTTTLACVCISA